MTIKQFTKNAFTNNLAFIIPLVLFYIFFGILLSTGGKGDFSLNSKYSESGDFFFKYISYIGDGIFVIILTLVILLSFSPRLAIIIAFVYSSGGILAQIIKRIANTPRPRLLFENLTTIHYVDGVDVYSFHSFPSGHATTAFGVFLILSIFTKNNYLKPFYFLCAFAVGISRIYLMQHFLVDVYFGSLLGIIVALVCYYSIMNWNSLNFAWWIDYSFIKSLRARELKK